MSPKYCPKGTHYNPDAGSCIKNLTSESYAWTLVAAVAIIAISRLICSCRRNRQQQPPQQPQQPQPRQ